VEVEVMRILATLQDADGGCARPGEIDMLAQKSEVRKVLGYLPQDFGFDFRHHRRSCHSTGTQRPYRN
jgi:ABC-type multidrug transport system ATPase subunit